MNKKIMCITLTILMLFSYVNIACAGSVSVKIPNFNVYVNQQLVNQQQSTYPLLVYKDITYFPMTWNFSQALGLNTSWDNINGFSINKGESYSSTLKQDLGANNNLGAYYSAGIPQFKITVNGKTIDNKNLQYPLLVFRNITYFPMTWDFAVNEFGLETNWDNYYGFSINNGFPPSTSNQSQNNSNLNTNTNTLNYITMLRENETYGKITLDARIQNAIIEIQIHKLREESESIFNQQINNLIFASSGGQLTLDAKTFNTICFSVLGGFITDDQAIAELKELLEKRADERNSNYLYLRTLM